MLALTIAVAMAIGVTLGLLGGGGSLLTLPFLVYALHIDPRVAIATSQLVVAATGIVAVVVHTRAGRVDWRAAAIFSPVSALGAYLGGRLAVGVPASLLLVIFGAVTVLAGLAMTTPLFPRRETATAQVALGTGSTIGGFIGVLAGLVGVGGGFLTVPALNLFAGLPMQRAIGTSLVVIAVQATAGYLGHAATTTVEWPLVATLCTASIAGSIVGALTAGRFAANHLRRGFGVLILLVGAGVLLQKLARL